MRCGLGVVGRGRAQPAFSGQVYQRLLVLISSACASIPDRRGLLGGQTPSVVANVTSKVGSVEDNQSGGGYACKRFNRLGCAPCRELARDSRAGGRSPASSFGSIG